jgi:hypothetical protein
MSTENILTRVCNFLSGTHGYEVSPAAHVLDGAVARLRFDFGGAVRRSAEAARRAEACLQSDIEALRSAGYDVSASSRPDHDSAGWHYLLAVRDIEPPTGWGDRLVDRARRERVL